MKVLMITKWDKKRSGITVHVESIIKNMNKDFAFGVLTYKKPVVGAKINIWGKEIEAVGIPFIDFPVLRALSFVVFGFFYFAYKNRNIRKAERAEIIHAHYALPQGMLGVLIKKLTGSRLVLTFHGSDALVLGRNFFLKHAVRFTANSADQVIAVSNYIKEVLVSLGISGEKIAVVPNGVEKGFKAPTGESRRIVFIGALVEQKNVEILLRAYKKVKEEISDAELFIAGEGKEKNSLLALAENLKLKDICFAGYVDDIDGVFTKNSCLVLPSKEEGFGIVLLEAMMRGVPVVASRIKSVEEIVKHEQNGLLFEKSNEDELYRAIVRIFTEEGLMDRLKKNGEEHARNFDWRKSAEEVGRIYRNLAES